MKEMTKEGVSDESCNDHLPLYCLTLIHCRKVHDQAFTRIAAAAAYAVLYHAGRNRATRCHHPSDRHLLATSLPQRLSGSDFTSSSIHCARALGWVN
jgi:hypothetical protein